MRFLSCAFMFGAAAAFGQTAAPSSSTPGFSLDSIDPSVSPCTDFYKYACGTWLKRNPIPADQASWGRFDELNERNQKILREILESAKSRGDAANPVETEIGTFYSACMDEKAANQKGAKPLQPEMDRIDAISNLSQFTAEVARLQRMGVNAVFQTGSGQDFKDATQVIAQLDQGGLGLPERDYYFKTDEKSVELRRQYEVHIRKIFDLLGESAEKAAADAATVMRVETALAKDSQDITSRRDPANEYHPMTIDKVITLAPAFNWNQYLKAVGAPVQTLNVVAPDFFKGFGALLARLSYADWKTYLTWQLVHAGAGMLAQPFVDQNFEFYGRILTGQKEQRPRWKRCVNYTDGALGEALGQAYVDRTFGAEGKERTLKMVRDIENAMEQDVRSVEWMTPETKKRAIEKLRAVANKIGYPDHWRNYSSIQLLPADLTGNAARSSEFEFARQMAKIGKPVDKLEWQMTPPTINAYYDPQMNNINFPAGILQPPFYDNKLDDAVNYGAIGAVIGHELTHGFDDQGRQFDGTGNFTDWWSKDDGKAYDERSKCIEDEYGGFTAVGSLKLNGKLTEGENIADNGGLRLAYMALKNLMAGRTLTDIDTFTPQQRFFLGFAQVWCENSRDELMRLQAQSDPHSLPEFRVNGTVTNMPEFAQAFSCKVGQPMAPAKNCRIW